MDRNKVTVNTGIPGTVRIDSLEPGELFYGQVSGTPLIRTVTGAVRLRDGRLWTNLDTFFDDGRNGRVRRVSGSVTIEPRS